MVRRVAKTPLITLAVDRGDPASLQRQIYDRLRQVILSGQIAPGARLPSSRTLARDLGVSRNTVLAAYEQLLYEGYTEGRAGSGTRVSDVLPESLLATRAEGGPAGTADGISGKLSNLTTGLSGLPPRTARGHRAFRPGLPDVALFPFDQWSRLLGRFWRRPPESLLHSGDLAGFEPLRQAIAAYLGAVRGVNCEGRQIIITSGAQQALDLISRVLLDPDDAVWLEDPGYAGLRGAFMAVGARIVPVPVDAEGLSVAQGMARAPDAVLAAVTPSHQYPLGVTMSLTRRLELLDWAGRSGAWILEDDYDSEYRYAGRALSALQGLDTSGRVIYVGTFSKVLFPTLRLGYMVVPPALVDPFLSVRAALDDQPSIAIQPALAEFIGQGLFAAHIRRMRSIYADRQQALVAALQSELSGLLDVVADEAGMHLVAHLRPGCGLSDGEASTRAAAAGLTVPALSEYYSGASDAQGLVLGYAALSEPEIDDNVEKLARALTFPP